jgi:hypothetical protein
LYSLRNSPENLAEGSLFCLFLKLVQIYFIFTDNVRILYIFFYETIDGRAIRNRLQNSFKIKDNNVYGSSYYWNFRTSSSKQVACLILQVDMYWVHPWRYNYVDILCTSCEVRVSAFYFTVNLLCFLIWTYIYIFIFIV